MNMLWQWKFYRHQTLFLPKEGYILLKTLIWQNARTVLDPKEFVAPLKKGRFTAERASAQTGAESERGDF